jgi:hypothetical protein
MAAALGDPDFIGCSDAGKANKKPCEVARVVSALAGVTGCASQQAGDPGNGTSDNPSDRRRGAVPPKNESGSNGPGLSST